MKTKRKTWYLQKKDILYVEENHDGKYGAKGKERDVYKRQIFIVAVVGTVI